MKKENEKNQIEKFPLPPYKEYLKKYPYSEKTKERIAINLNKDFTLWDFFESPNHFYYKLSDITKELEKLTPKNRKITYEDENNIENLLKKFLKFNFSYKNEIDMYHKNIIELFINGLSMFYLKQLIKERKEFISERKNNREVAKKMRFTEMILKIRKKTYELFRKKNKDLYRDIINQKNKNLELEEKTENIRKQRGTINQYFNEWESKSIDIPKGKKEEFYKNEFIIDKPELKNYQYKKFSDNFRKDKSNRYKALHKM